MTFKTILFIIALFVFNLFPFTSSIKVFAQFSYDTIASKYINEEKFVLINGIEQWVTIKGDRSKPVILFLHGGPGSPISPYSDNLYKEWEKEFVIVQWDQRGTGRTFGLHAPEELSPEFIQSNPLTVEQMASDGIELSEYLVKHLQKQKIILFGTSWGSVLGVKMAAKRPDLYYAYVGHSQVVDASDYNPLYNRIYQVATQSNDRESLAILDSIGRPPYERARNAGKLLRVVKKYEKANSLPAPEDWFVEAKAYDNDKDAQNRSDGDDFSFVNFMGDKHLGVKPMHTTINFLRDHVEFKIPIHFIQGEEDILTPKEATKSYFDKIKASEKKFILLPTAAHGFNEAVLEAQHKVFRSIKAF